MRRGKGRSPLNAIARFFGYGIVSDDRLYKWQKELNGSARRTETVLPGGAKEYLSCDNKRLKELEDVYGRMDGAVAKPPFWTKKHLREIDIRSFRGDNPYIWQTKGINTNVLSYALAAYYLMANDPLGLMSKLKEDGLFGAKTYRVAGRLVSRDLLDSIDEITFLERHIGISRLHSLKIIDIGAGYGRLAHRMARAIPASIEIFICADTVALSTFLSEYYIHFRDVSEKASVAPVHKIESFMNRSRFDIALNIHSFSECSAEAIKWWLDLLRRNHTRYLMIIPNPRKYHNEELLDHSYRDYSGMIKECGYKLIVREPKYRDPVVQRYGLMPVYYYLYKLKQ